MIWPNHCLVGSSGHNVTPILLDALLQWERRNKSAVKYILKGHNSKTEHYSAIQAEVVVPEDTQTQLNTALLEELRRHEKVLICGQALSYVQYLFVLLFNLSFLTLYVSCRSHCVNYTTRDVVDNWDPKELHRLVLLEVGNPSVAFRLE